MVQFVGRTVQLVLLVLYGASELGFVVILCFTAQHRLLPWAMLVGLDAILVQQRHALTCAVHNLVISSHIESCLLSCNQFDC